MEDNIELVRRTLRTHEKKIIYNTARAILPSILLKKYPKIYNQIITELKDSLSQTLDRNVEAQLWLYQDQGRIDTLAAGIKMRKEKEKERRKQNEKVWTNREVSP